MVSTWTSWRESERRKLHSKPFNHHTSNLLKTLLTTNIPLFLYRHKRHLQNPVNQPSTKLSVTADASSTISFQTRPSWSKKGMSPPTNFSCANGRDLKSSAMHHGSMRSERIPNDSIQSKISWQLTLPTLPSLGRTQMSASSGASETCLIQRTTTSSRSTIKNNR